MSGTTVLVWGNCQAGPLADLLTAPLAAAGLQIVITPPVYLVDEVELARVHDVVAGCAALISQPIGDNYRFPACATAALAARLPADARLLTFPVAHHVGAFPFQVRAHGADGARVEAPITDYHDLRAVTAAARGYSPSEAVAWWPAPREAGVREVAARSTAELRRREQSLDVRVSDLLDAADAMWTMTHPANRVLAAIADRLLGSLVPDAAGTPSAPAREYLAERQTPVEAAVVHARDWPVRAIRPNWRLNGRDLELIEIVTAHLDLYRRRPDVVADTLSRFADRLVALGLTGRRTA